MSHVAFTRESNDLETQGVRARLSWETRVPLHGLIIQRIVLDLIEGDTVWRWTGRHFVARVGGSGSRR